MVAVLEKSSSHQLGLLIMGWSMLSVVVVFERGSNHLSSAGVVYNGVVNAFSKLPTSQPVAPFHYHALNYILGQIVTAVCIACDTSQTDCPLLWSLLSTGFIPTHHRPTTYMYATWWMLVGVAILGGTSLKGPSQLWGKFYKRQSCPHYQLLSFLSGV